MTIQGWVLFGILALFILSFGIFGAIIFEKIVWKVLGIVAPCSSSSDSLPGCAGIIRIPPAVNGQ